MNVWKTVIQWYLGPVWYINNENRAVDLFEFQEPEERLKKTKNRKATWPEIMNAELIKYEGSVLNCVSTLDK